MTEAELQVADFGSGVKLTPRQASIQKRQNGGRRAWPDMFIAEPKSYWQANDNGLGAHKEYISGLYIELKKDGIRLKKKNGDWATEHIEEQAEVLDKLRKRGYSAEFAVGFEEAKRIIDEYLGR